jgi:hypothetical protein
LLKIREAEMQRAQFFGSIAFLCGEVRPGVRSYFAQPGVLFPFDEVSVEITDIRIRHDSVLRAPPRLARLRFLPFPSGSRRDAVFFWFVV